MKKLFLTIFGTEEIRKIDCIKLIILGTIFAITGIGCSTISYTIWNQLTTIIIIAIGSSQIALGVYGLDLC